MARSRRTRTPPPQTSGPRYIFATGAPLRFPNANLADAQIIGETLEDIKQRKGSLRREDVWQDAEGKPDHPLYHHFTWDLRQAAEAHWNEQAGELVRVIRVIDDQETPRHAFLSIRTGPAGTSYYSAAQVVRSAELRRLVLIQAERDLRAWEDRYNELEAFLGPRPLRGVRTAIQRQLGHDNGNGDGDGNQPSP